MRALTRRGAYIKFCPSRAALCARSRHHRRGTRDIFLKRYSNMLRKSLRLPTIPNSFQTFNETQTTAISGVVSVPRRVMVAQRNNTLRHTP
jgi:hypothetical protein